jgi:hypothetical protein
VARGKTVLQVCVEKLGVHKGAIAAAWVTQWVMATEALGHVPNVIEYSEWWYVDERTGWRHRAAVKSVLGDEWQAVVAELADEMRRRRLKSPRSVRGLTVAAS